MSKEGAVSHGDSIYTAEARFSGLVSKNRASGDDGTRCPIGREEANERKKAKYQQLAEKCEQRGLKTWFVPIEMGCKGFVGRSVWISAGLLGIIGLDRRQLVTAVSRQAETAFQWLLRKRGEAWKRPL